VRDFSDKTSSEQVRGGHAMVGHGGTPGEKKKARRPKKGRKTDHKVLRGVVPITGRTPVSNIASTHVSPRFPAHKPRRKGAAKKIQRVE